MRRRRISTRSLTAKLAAVSAAGALAIGGGLAVQMAHGSDPALGPKAQAEKSTTSAQTSLGTDSAQQSASVIPGASSSIASQPSQPQDSVSSPAPVTTRSS
jgi:hypothetical protein